MHNTFPTLAAALLAATGALAQEADPSSQEFEAPYTYTVVDLSSMPMGRGQQAFVAESFLVHTAAEGLLAGLAGHCLYTEIGNLKTTLQAAGTCVLQDAQGNELWQSWEGAPEGFIFRGKGTWIGGTGRFEGASGEMTFETTWLASPRDGVNQGTGVRQGHPDPPGSMSLMEPTSGMNQNGTARLHRRPARPDNTKPL